MVKYYDENIMSDVRKYLEKTIEAWPGVKKKVMFGCPSYMARGDIFAILTTGGVGITRLPNNAREYVIEKFQGGPFTAGKRVVKNWVVVPVRYPEDLNPLIPCIKRSYRSVMIQE